MPLHRFSLERLSLGLVALAALLGWQGTAAAQNQIKPRFLIMIDVSGSMDESTDDTSSGNGSCNGSATDPDCNSCGQTRNRMNDAKCVLGKLNDSFGDIEFALGRFKQLSCTGSCDWSNDACAEEPAGDADRGEMLVPFGPENANDIGEWVDFTCSGCTTSTAGANNPELDYGGNTPLTGYILAARRYLQGGDPTFTTNPISTDTFASCRPYRVIMLTDGDVNCTGESRTTTTTAIKQLRRTGTAGVPEGVMPIDVRTDVIGFGIAPGDADIEAYAQAGGRANVSGQNEGFYATDEASLALAFSQIVEGSLLVEVCDGVDNDCDTLIDEGFNIGTPCDGNDTDVCTEGVIVCTSPTTTGCTDAAGENDVEICNQLDDDCDGLVDEPPANCPACTLQPEICDGIDNNCNNMIDEGITRPCGTDVGSCTAGTETCVNGAFVGCTATSGTTETCNNLDDDCDGVVDGITRDCGAPTTGECQPGQQVCQAGSFGACIGAVGPQAEGCDNLDNDCNGMVDDNVPGLGAPCGTACGQGTTTCTNGMITCTGGGGGSPEVCNNQDDDCDGLVDDGIPDMGPCTVDDNMQELCEPGIYQCVGGEFSCVGGVLPQPEACDCVDSDCDGVADPDEPNLCGTNGTCLDGPHCQCALPCQGGEFPCPEGFICTEVEVRPGQPLEDFCVRDRCVGVTCAPTASGAETTCVNGSCVPSCELANCPSSTVCRESDGECVEDNCNGFPERCSATQFCIDGVCTADPCVGVSCTAPEYCAGGTCVRSCTGVPCGEGQICVMGACQDSPCAGVTCPSTSQVCNPETGMCQQSQCLGRDCPSGQACDPLTGECGADPCLGVVCPGPGEVCVRGTCDVPPAPPDQAHDYVSAAGSGCACRTGTRDDLPPPITLLVLAGFVGVLLRRRGEDR